MATYDCTINTNDHVVHVMSHGGGFIWCSILCGNVKLYPYGESTSIHTNIESAVNDALRHAAGIFADWARDAESAKLPSKAG